MDYGPHIIFVLNCVVRLSLNTSWSYCLEQGSVSTKKNNQRKKFAQGYQKWWNQRDARLQASAENFRLCGKMNIFS